MSWNLNIFGVFWTNQLQSGKVVSERRVAGDIISLVNVKGLEFECARIALEGHKGENFCLSFLF